MAADWDKIRAEYITTDTSYRILAQKYGVDQSTVARRAKKEGWVALRQRHAVDTQAKILEADGQRRAEQARRIQTVADKLLDRVERLIEDDTVSLYSKALRELAATLRDLREVQGVRSRLDEQEQEARIEKLRRDAQRAEDAMTAGTVTLVIEGEDGYGL